MSVASALAGSLALSLALWQPAAAFSAAPVSWSIPKASSGWHLHVKTAMAPAARPRRPELGMSLSHDAVSASRDKETLLRQVPTEPVAKGMAGPSEAQLFSKLKGDAIPWVVTALLVLPAVFISKSLIPAVLVGIIDLVWFVYNYVQARAMNAPAKPEPVSRGLLELWEKCLTESPDGPADFVVGWFYDAPLASISREDVEVWLASTCFSTTYDRLVPESRSDVLLIFDLIETKLSHRFPPRAEGQAPVPCMRFSIEKLEWTHKPFVFYAVCQGVLGSLGMLSLWGEGFSRHRSGVFDYWVRMPETQEARQRTPIVFCHGIGVGLIMYFSFIKALLTHDCPIILLELPFISGNIAPGKIPSISEQVSSMEQIFNRWGLDKGLFVGHSYGSVLLSWMAQHLPSRVAGLALVDPVVMMLNLKSILYNFLYKHDGDGKISDLIGTELHINNALRRNFWWYRNILWCSDLQSSGLPSLVCLSENDEIVPSSAVQRHVQQHAQQMGDSNLVESYMMHGANHGDMLFNPEVMEGLQERIGEHYDKIEIARSRRGVDTVAARYPRSLGNVFGAWQTLVQLKWGARRLSATANTALDASKPVIQPVVDFVKRLRPA